MKLKGKPVVGFGETEVVVPVTPPSSPWKLAVATSMLSAATGWAIEAVASKVRRRKR